EGSVLLIWLGLDPLETPPPCPPRNRREKLEPSRSALCSLVERCSPGDACLLLAQHLPQQGELAPEQGQLGAQPLVGPRVLQQRLVLEQLQGKGAGDQVGQQLGMHRRLERLGLLVDQLSQQVRILAKGSGRRVCEL